MGSDGRTCVGSSRRAVSSGTSEVEVCSSILMGFSGWIRGSPNDGDRSRWSDSPDSGRVRVEQSTEVATAATDGSERSWDGELSGWVGGRFSGGGSVQRLGSELGGALRADFIGNSVIDLSPDQRGDFPRLIEPRDPDFRSDTTSPCGSCGCPKCNLNMWGVNVWVSAEVRYYRRFFVMLGRRVFPGGIRWDRLHRRPLWWFRSL